VSRPIAINHSHDVIVCRYYKKNSICYISIPYKTHPIYFQGFSSFLPL